MTAADGPLIGVKILEFAGLGPAPFAGMMLADMGADILRIDRPGARLPGREWVDARGRRILGLDLKDPAAVEFCLRAAEKADIIFEGFRPGVMERLGLGPDVMLSRNPALVYGRMTGWGQDGPYAHTAGHDINYLALSGVLHAIGTRERPVPPLNLVGDYGGGALFLVVGMLAALLRARMSGRGQVVDAGMVDGAGYLMSPVYGMLAGKLWVDAREANLTDGGAAFYGVYRCADEKWITIGPVEPQFYALLLDKLGASEAVPQGQMDRAAWPEMRRVFADIFSTKTRDDWCALLEGTDVCFAPVMSLTEAPHHAQNVARKAFIEFDGLTIPAPAPRFSETQGTVRPSRVVDLEEAETLLAQWGRDGSDAK